MPGPIMPPGPIIEPPPPTPPLPPAFIIPPPCCGAMPLPIMPWLGIPEAIIMPLGPWPIIPGGPEPPPITPGWGAMPGWPPIMLGWPIMLLGIIMPGPWAPMGAGTIWPSGPWM